MPQDVDPWPPRETAWPADHVRCDRKSAATQRASVVEPGLRGEGFASVPGAVTAALEAATIERLAIRRSLTSNLLPLSGETIRDLGRVLRWRASETGGRPRDVLRPEVLTLVSADRRRALIDAYAEGLRLRYDAVYPAIHRVGDKLAAELEARIRLGSPIPMARVRLPWKRPKHTSAPNKKSWRACEGS